MAAQWTLREIDAPDKPYLTKLEVANLFGFESTTTIDDMVTRGQLPEPVRRSGTPVWSWKDVVFANLLMELQGRLRPPAGPAAGPETDRNRPDPTGSARNRPKSAGPLNPTDPTE